jgi:hypothetical protein
MAQIPILAGINTTSSADFSVSYPRNLMPIAYETGLSSGYLKSAEGIDLFSTFEESILGGHRGAINWNELYYAVIGQHFVSMDKNGNVTIIDTLPTGGYVRFDFSFDYLAIACSNNLYLYDGTTVTQVTDPDLKEVIDMIWIDGYFMTTDGEFIVITEINDPFAVNPLKYGALQNDPSPILALLKVKDEAYALSRYSISPLDNVGGTGFPFEVVKGGVVQKGTIGTRTACTFMDTIAFMGSGRNEQPSVYLVNAGSAQKIATEEIERQLRQYTELELSQALLECRAHDDMQHLYIHLPNETLVYDFLTSAKLQQSVWFVVSSSETSYGLYRARNFTWIYDKWICGDIVDARKIGYLTKSSAGHYGNEVGYQFDTPIIYTEGTGAIVHQLEIVPLTGREYDGENFTDKQIAHQYSTDGVTWSMARFKSLGRAGQRNKRVIWLNCGRIRNWAVQRFSGKTKVAVGFARLEALFEKLA